MKSLVRLFGLLILLWPLPAIAETIQIPGPQGPLAAEAITVKDASHAVIIIPGSGPIDRDGNAAKLQISTDTYKLLAEGMASHGIASLRIDKRGFFGSASAISNPNDVTIKAYAKDARDWVEQAVALAPCVWIAGHSEGGLVALVAAMDPPKILCGLILMATPGRPIGQLTIAQLEANLSNAPLMPEIKAIIADLQSGKTRDPDSMSLLLRPLFAVGLQRYMIDVFSYDPAEIAHNWKGPVLIVQGDADIQVRPLDADLLESAMPQAARLDLSGGTHMLKADIEGQPFATYQDRSLPLHSDLVPGIVRFIKSTPAK